MRTLTRLEKRVVPGQLEHAERVLPSLLPHASPEMRILDFGNGSGAIAHSLAKKTGAHIVGVDVAQNTLFPIPAVAYDGKNLPFRDDSFDLVYAVFVLHHCPDVESALREMRRVARRKILLVEDVWYTFRDRFWMYVFHIIFDFFMLLVTLVGRGKWPTFFSYRFQDDDGWKAYFERLGLVLCHAEDIVLHPRYPVKHRGYVLEKRPFRGRAA